MGRISARPPMENVRCAQVAALFSGALALRNFGVVDVADDDDDDSSASRISRFSSDDGIRNRSRGDKLRKARKLDMYYKSGIDIDQLVVDRRRRKRALAKVSLALPTRDKP